MNGPARNETHPALHDDVRPLAVVIGHADFAHGLVSAVEQVCGRGAELIAVSNAGKSGAQIEQELERTVARTRGQLIFTDLPAGSATMAARRLVRRSGGITLVTGANLALLLDVLFAPDAESGAFSVDAMRAITERAKASLAVTVE